MKILFLSCESLTGYVSDDFLLVTELQEQGHTVETIPWTFDTDWKRFDCAIIRTTWDYVSMPEKFFKKLQHIATQTKLYNSISTVEWNIHKRYLKMLESKGVAIVPTLMFKHDEDLKIPPDWSAAKFVVKPAISATSYKTVVLPREKILNHEYKNELVPGDWMCQPFVPNITDGEVSLIYFNKKFSHALLKVPKAGDFRVQEEFGGEITAYNATQELLALGQKIMEAIPEELLYARVDLVPYENHFALMELELIEPSLYFRTNPNAAKNFAKALMDVEIKD